MSAATIVELPAAFPRPEGWPYINASAAYSNLFHQFDAGTVERLENEPAYGQHAAWDFCGYVWHAEGVWFESVWQHHVPVAAYSCVDLAALVAHVNDEWGHE